jgi:antitoxin component YwqK of YwqJK toxin-antitoxin module
MGKFKTEFNFKDGKLNGENVTHSGKQLFFECNYVNGLMDGKNRSWYIGGMPHREDEFKNGVQINESIIWYKNGNLQIFKVFENCKAISTKTYFQNGLLRTEETHNSKESTYIYYFESGKIKSKSVSTWDSIKLQYSKKTQCWDENGSEVQCPE